MKKLALFASILVLCIISGCSSHTPKASLVAQPPLITVDRIRESLPNDYLRVSFVSAGTTVTTLSRPGALRAFVSATTMDQPPLAVKDLPPYSGLVNNDSQVMVAMRCKPERPETVDAILATWPNIFLAIPRDTAVSPEACTGTPTEASLQLACYAKAFQDTPATAVPTALAITFQYAGVIYDGKHDSWKSWLQSNYGIYPAFAGTGYSIKDSYYLDKQPMTAQTILVKSISSEYVLKNVSLSDAGCHCISVAPYPGRAEAILSPEFIEKTGSLGACKSVDKLSAPKQ